MKAGQKIQGENCYLTVKEVKTEKIEKLKFQINKTYRGVSRVGTAPLRVVRRSEKSIWILWSGEVKRIKIDQYDNERESATFWSWTIRAGREYSKEQQIEDSYNFD